MYPLWQVGLVSILPGLLWLWFFHRQDAYEPEPWWLLLALFGLGMASVLPSLLLEMPWRAQLLTSLRQHDLLKLAFLTFAVIAVIEEAAKLAVLYCAVHRVSEFDEPLDGIIYGITVGLGFAALENFLYAVSRGPAVGLFRAVVTSLAHASFSGWLGYFLAKARFGRAWTPLLPGFALAVLLHGAYNFALLGAHTLSGLVSFLLVGGAMILLLRKMRELEAWSPHRSPGRP